MHRRRCNYLVTLTVTNKVWQFVISDWHPIFLCAEEIVVFAQSWTVCFLLQLSLSSICSCTTVSQCRFVLPRLHLWNQLSGRLVEIYNFGSWDWLGKVGRSTPSLLSGSKQILHSLKFGTMGEQFFLMLEWNWNNNGWLKVWKIILLCCGAF